MQVIPIPPLISPATLVMGIAWLCLIGGIFKIVGAVTHGGKADAPGRDIQIGAGLIIVYLVLFWVLTQVAPYITKFTK